jgi:hypothetical protein
VPAQVDVVIGDHHEVERPGPDLLLAPGAPVGALPRDLPHRDPLGVRPGGGDARWLPGRRRRGAVPGGAVSARHFTSPLVSQVEA